MSGLTLDAAKEAKDEANQDGLRENEAGIPDDAFDYTEHDAPIVRGHPECLITFDRIVGLAPFNPGENFLSTRQNLEGAGERGWGNQVMLTLENPELVEGQLWDEEHNFRDFRVIGDPTSDDSPYSRDENVQYDDDGEVTGVEVNGVSLGMGGFDGEVVEDGQFGSDYVQILVQSSRAARLLGALDTAGLWAIDTEGDLTEGIIEAPPELGSENYDTDTHGAPRAIGYPELRADMVGQKGAIAWTFDDDEPTTQSRVDITLYKVEDGEIVEALSPLTPEDDAYALPTYPRGNNLYWDHDSVEGQDMGSDAAPENPNGAVEAKEMMSGGSDDEDTVTDDEAKVTYSGLSESGQEFVDSAVEAIETMDYESVTDFDDWDERFATATSGENPDIDVAQATAEHIIDNQIEG